MDALLFVWAPSGVGLSPPCRLMAALTSTHVDSNMRKESKLYSIDDQRWEAEIKAEQTRKRLAELKGQSVRDLLQVGEVSRRLKDTVLARLEEEEQTRQQLTQVGSSQDGRTEHLST